MIFTRLVKGGNRKIISNYGATLFLVDVDSFLSEFYEDDNGEYEDKEGQRKMLENVAELMEKIAEDIGYAQMDWKEIMIKEYGSMNDVAHIEWEKLGQISINSKHLVSLTWGTLFE